MSLWVFSPITAMNDALRLYVAELGFEVELDPAKARAALFDLSSAGSLLPPPPPLPSLALLGATQADAADEARRAGYAVHLPTDGEECLRAALAQLLSESCTRSMDARETPEGAPKLTPREAQVMSLLMLGLTNKRIAKHLMITERTVKFHVSGVMRKHGVSNRTKLMLKNPIIVTRLYSGQFAARR
jgi:DNA-binding CsgD family transcriptional regulator